MNGSLTKTTAFRPVVAGTVMFAAMIALPPESVAQSGATKSELPGSADNDILKARALELAAIRAEQQRAAETEARLRREIEALGTDRRKLNTDLIGTAARMRDVEARLSATEARVAPLEAQEQDLRQSLSDRRGTIAEILAALQRMGRRPPPALLVSPEDAANSLRSAIVLGAFVPELRDRAERISTDLLALQRLRGDIANERSKLSDDLKTLAEDQKRMTLLVEERQKQQAESERPWNRAACRPVRSPGRRKA
jgi:septal ring factor EnvC (AmiA/AmiB activator)